MTPDELLSHGYKPFSWNGGAIMEYWKPLRGRTNFEYRLSVRFGEHRDYPFMAYITASTGMFRLPNIQTVTELEILYTLLREPKARKA